MVEQWYAKHKTTGEIFHKNGRYCFTKKGLLQSLKNEKRWADWWAGQAPARVKPFLLSDYEMKRIELT